MKKQRWLSKKRKAKSSVIYAQESVDGNSKEMLKRVWFSFVGINCVWMARVNEQSDVREEGWSRRRPESKRYRCVKEKRVVTRGSGGCRR